MLYSPAAVVRVLVWTLVPREMAVTAAPAITAPLGSFTTPVILPRSLWEKTGRAIRNSANDFSVMLGTYTKTSGSCQTRNRREIGEIGVSPRLRRAFHQCA